MAIYSRAIRAYEAPGNRFECAVWANVDSSDSENTGTELEAVRVPFGQFNSSTEQAPVDIDLAPEPWRVECWLEVRPDPTLNIIHVKIFESDVERIYTKFPVEDYQNNPTGYLIVDYLFDEVTS